MEIWKAPHIVKGTLSWIPALNRWRSRHASTGGTNSPRYCYSVWLRHLAMLSSCGFVVKNAVVGELGPGDSIGVGLAALLSGAGEYIGLDAVRFASRPDLTQIFDCIVQMYSKREPIPDQHEFPRVRPELDSYDFPIHAIDSRDLSKRVASIRREIEAGVNSSKVVRYLAPWTSTPVIPAESLDLIISQSVLQYVDTLEETYRSMAQWLRPGGYASHSIDLSGHYLSPFWNGHWAYRDWEWRLARGGRAFFLNREPLSTHLSFAKKFGFEILISRKEFSDRGLPTSALAPRFQVLLNPEELRTRGAFVVLRKCASC